MLNGLPSISSLVDQMQPTDILVPDNAHMALYCRPTFTAYRAFTHSSEKPARLFHRSIQAFRVSSKLALSPEQYYELRQDENILSPIMRVQLHAKLDYHNCCTKVVLLPCVQIHPTLPLGIFTTLFRLQH